MTRRSPRAFAALCATLFLASGTSAAAQSTLITGALVVDGSGGPPVVASVRVQGDRIVDVGDL